MYIMHFETVVLVERAADEARRARNPTLLAKFILVGIWGVDNQDFYCFTGTVFHVSHVKALRINRILCATPYTVRDFTGSGQFADANWDSFMGSFQPSRSLDDLAEYSA